MAIPEIKYVNDLCSHCGQYGVTVLFLQQATDKTLHICQVCFDKLPLKKIEALFAEAR